MEERKTVTVIKDEDSGTRTWSLNLNTLQVVLAFLLSIGSVIGGGVSVAAKIAEPVIAEQVNTKLEGYVTVEAFRAQLSLEAERWAHVNQTLTELREDVRWLVRREQNGRE